MLAVVVVFSRTVVRGHCTLGGCVSPTTTVKEQVEVSPLVSVAVQETTVVPEGYWKVPASEPGGVHETEAMPTLSTATRLLLKLAVEKFRPGSVDSARGSGQTIEGGEVSVTVSVVEHERLLFPRSYAVQVRTVEPTGTETRLETEMNVLV
jgi:hypothetical protein